MHIKNKMNIHESLKGIVFYATDGMGTASKHRRLWATGHQKRQERSVSYLAQLFSGTYVPLAPSSRIATSHLPLPKGCWLFTAPSWAQFSPSECKCHLCQQRGVNLCVLPCLTPSSYQGGEEHATFCKPRPWARTDTHEKPCVNSAVLLTFTRAFHVDIHTIKQTPLATQLWRCA